MRSVLVLCGLLFSACDASSAADFPVEALANRPSVTTPTPPATGVNPCTGWPGGLFGATAVYTHDLNTVSFHGGTWTVPIAARPGDSISDVAFTIEAPTGHLGDPTSVRVGLYSNGNALAFANLTPFGIGARVNGDIPFSTPRIIAPGETLALEFAPLDAVAGAYATSDTKIDVIGVSRPRPTRTDKLSVLGAASIGGAFQVINGQLTGNWSPVSDGDILGLNVPVHAGDRFESVSASIAGSTGYTVTLAAFSQDDAFHVGARLGAEQTSTAQNSTQTLTVVPIANDNTNAPEQVTSAQRSYFLQLRAHRIGSGVGQLYVGPMTLTTSQSN